MQLFVHKENSKTLEKLKDLIKPGRIPVIPKNLEIEIYNFLIDLVHEESSIKIVAFEILIQEVFKLKLVQAINKTESFNFT